MSLKNDDWKKKEVKDWDNSDVYWWTRSVPSCIPAAYPLKRSEITGAQLIELLAEGPEKLEDAPYNMSTSVSQIIAERLEELMKGRTAGLSTDEISASNKSYIVPKGELMKDTSSVGIANSLSGSLRRSQPLVKEPEPTKKEPKTEEKKEDEEKKEEEKKKKEKKKTVKEKKDKTIDGGEIEGGEKKKKSEKKKDKEKGKGKEKEKEEEKDGEKKKHKKHKKPKKESGESNDEEMSSASDSNESDNDFSEVSTNGTSLSSIPTIMITSSASSFCCPGSSSASGSHSGSVSGSASGSNPVALVQTMRSSSHRSLDFMRRDSAAPSTVLDPLFLRGDAKQFLEGIKTTDLCPYTGGIDYWSSRRQPEETWTDNEEPEKCGADLIDRSCLSEGYHIENTFASTRHDPGVDDLGLVVRDSEEEIRFYKEYIEKGPFIVLLMPTIPAIVTVQNPDPKTLKHKDEVSCRVISRTKNGDKRYVIPMKDLKKWKQLRELMNVDKNTKIVPLPKGKEEQMKVELEMFEDKYFPQQNYKFGIIYCRKGQHDENDMYGNIHSDVSDAYKEFLDFMGETIRLKGWEGYRAGLDVKYDNTGTESVFTKFRNYSVMFHVATLLPNQEDDPQKVERKRHIGNDVVTIIFKEQENAEDRFNPSILTTHFIHCVFVISPVLNSAGKTTHYRLSISNHSGVPAYYPHFPKDCTDGVFEKGPEFREWLLVKMINSERAAMNAAGFQSLKTARKQHLEIIINDVLS